MWRLSTPEPRGRDLRDLVLTHGLRTLCTWGLGLLIGLLVLASELGPDNVPLWVSSHIPEDALVYLAATGYSLSLLLVAVWLYRIGQRADSKSLRWRAGLVAIFSAMTAPSFACWSLHAMGFVDLGRADALIGLLSLGSAMLLPALVIFFTMAVSAWRMLQVAEVQARALRNEIKVWQGPPPGESWQQRAVANTPAGEASADPAEAPHDTR